MQQLRLKKYVPGRFLKNIGGTLVVFTDGIASYVSENTLKLAAKDASIIVENVVTLTEEVAEITAEGLQLLYEEKGTWAKVAAHLDMTVSKLSSLRKSLE